MLISIGDVHTLFEFHSAWERPKVVFIDRETLRIAEQSITSCEACTPQTASMLFDDVLDGLTGCDPTSTEYELAGSVRCPRCMREIDSGSWHWFTSGQNQELVIRPATLVTLKNEAG